MSSKPEDAETEEERLRRLLKIMGDHAVSYKSKFHDMQEEIWRLEKLYYKFKGRAERQSEYIAELEHTLGIDDAL